MNKTIGWIIVAVVVVVGGWYLTNGNKTTPASNEPIKIGFIGDLTKDVAALGQNAKRGVGMVVKEVNSKGGIGGRMVEVIYEDGKCNGTSASNAASKLINVDRVSAIIGGFCSSETLAIAPIAEQSKIPILSFGSSAPSITQAGDYVFRDYPSDSYQGVFAANYVYQTLGKKRAAVLYSKSDWGIGIEQTFIKRFTELGGAIVADEGADQAARDLRTELSKIKKANPEVLYLVAYPESSIPGIRQLREIKLNIPVIGGDAWEDPTIWEKVGTDGNGMEYVAVAPPTNEFKEKFLKETGYEVSAGTAQAYDAANIIFDVIGRFGLSGEKIKDGLYTIKDYQGATGTIGFDQNGDLTAANYVLKVVKDGKAVELK